MKVYIVTAGEYSDYHIEAVFTDPVKAKMFANLDSDRVIEEYEADSVIMSYSRNPIMPPDVYTVYYDFKNDKVNSFRIGFGLPHAPDSICDIFMEPMLQLFIPDNERLHEDILLHGKESKLLKKIAQDRLAAYLYEHGLQREELIEKIKEDKNKRIRDYHFASTSSSFTAWTPYAAANTLITERIRQMIHEGKEAPDPDTLKKMVDDAVLEVLHEQD